MYCISKRSLFFFLLGLFNLNVLLADVGPRFAFSGGFLYLLPTVDDTFFVLVQNEVTENSHIDEKVNNDFGFHTGFFVAATCISEKANRQFTIDYQQLNAHTKKIVNGPVLSASVGSAITLAAGEMNNFIGIAISDLHLMHKQADIVINQPVWGSPKLQISFIAGVEFAYNRLAEDYLYEFPIVDDDTFQAAQTKLKSSTWGIGPQVGIAFNHLLLQFSRNILYLELLGTGSVLSSRTTGSILSFLFGDTEFLFDDIHSKKTWRLVPALHASFGLSLLINRPSFDVLFHAGYEFNSYLRGLARIAFPSTTADGLNYTYYYNFDIQGLVVSASVSF